MTSKGSVLCGLGAGAAGFALLAIGLHIDSRRAAYAYLVAFAYALTIALGALFFAMVANVTRARWYLVFQRVVQALFGTLPLFALLFVPIVIGLRTIYPWPFPSSALDAAVREAVEHKRAWLSPGFFVARSVVYLGVWITLGELLRRWSLRRDDEHATQFGPQRRALSAGGLPALMLTVTFASFDWLMSIEPAWTSNVYGIYVLAAGFSGACAAIAVFATSDRSREVGDVIHGDHLLALGRMLLTAVMTWSYIAFVQFLILWMADIPEEIAWYRSRGFGAWEPVAIALVFAQFVVPFAALLSRGLKRSRRGLMVVGAWLLVAHYIDVYWLVMPALRPVAWSPHWLDLAGVLAVCGPCFALVSWRYAAAPTVPTNDPALTEALRYHSP